MQAQLLGYSYQDNDTLHEVAINLFAFVGLALDVLGAAAGLTANIAPQDVDYNTLKVHQSRYREAHDQLIEKERQLPPQKPNGHSRNSSIQSLFNLPRSSRGLSNMSCEKTSQDDAVTLTVPVGPSPSPSMTSVNLTTQEQCRILRKQVRDARKRLFLHMLLALKNDLHRVVCVELMKFGIQSFFLSLILFVCHTQPKLVWISVLVVMLVGSMASPIGKTLGMVERAVLQRMDKQAAERVMWLDEVDGDSVFDAAEARELREMEKTKQKDKDCSDKELA